MSGDRRRKNAPLQNKYPRFSQLCSKELWHHIDHSHPQTISHFIHIAVVAQEKIDSILQILNCKTGYSVSKLNVVKASLMKEGIVFTKKLI